MFCFIGDYIEGFGRLRAMLVFKGFHLIIRKEDGFHGLTKLKEQLTTF